MNEPEFHREAGSIAASPRFIAPFSNYIRYGVYGGLFNSIPKAIFYIYLRGTVCSILGPKCPYFRLFNFFDFLWDEGFVQTGGPTIPLEIVLFSIYLPRHYGPSCCSFHFIFLCLVDLVLQYFGNIAQPYVSQP